ncbi:MAG: glycosyltransferase [Calditrichaeota bacterium]|nr:glycosyltransferase [Calditrichota bacterium]MCB9366004.1 glycosyltransferase [Calditrichota bacterium]MCB9391870.1 glycosyltransferase [Calditrichota bacterium]
MPMLTPSENKTVSIIIPVFNRAELTERCLESIANAANRASYEVIVVDNGSTDGTKQLLSGIEGDITVITNRTNEGFAAACNRGSKLASAEWLLFLNNDTEVSDGYLDQLLNCASSLESCGAVGARLLYPSGRTQHAGLAFNNECTPYHIFQNFEADHPSVTESRKMSAVTAACMLIHSELFADFNGFDTSFVNGFEDVDLCLKLKQAGRTNYYCGTTNIIHHEESSEGRKNHDGPNLRLFQQRWNRMIEQDDAGYLAAHGLTIEWTATGGTYKKLTHEVSSLTHAENDSAVLLDLAQKKYVEGLHEEAAALLQRIVSSRMTLGKDDEFESWQLLGNCMTRLNRAIEAERAYLHAATANSESERPFLGLGSVAMLQENWTAAQYGFLAALSKNPNTMRAEFGLGVSLLARQQHDEALPHFSRVAESDPSNADAVFYLYRAAMESNRPHLAIGALSRYLESKPDDAEFWFHLSGALWKSGSQDDALSACKKVLELNPDHGQAKQTLEYMSSHCLANA